jgi:hypothetical protein
MILFLLGVFAWLRFPTLRQTFWEVLFGVLTVAVVAITFGAPGLLALLALLAVLAYRR